MTEGTRDIHKVKRIGIRAAQPEGNHEVVSCAQHCGSHRDWSELVDRVEVPGYVRVARLWEYPKKDPEKNPLSDLVGDFTPEIAYVVGRGANWCIVNNDVVVFSYSGAPRVDL